MQLQTLMPSTDDPIRNTRVIAPTTTCWHERNVSESSAVRTNRSFRRLHILLPVLIVMVLIVVLLTCVITIKLGKMEKQMNRTQDRLSKNIGEAINILKNSQQRDDSMNMSVSQPKEQQTESSEKSSPYLWPHCPETCTKMDFPTPPLLILSMDGFSRKYLDRYKLSSLNYMAKCGATAERVYPSFPTRTYPNHYTIVTGLYPESHGIVDNSIYDGMLSDTMESMKNTKKQGFFQGDPIWNAYKRHGGRTACIFWPGCAYAVSGLKPDINIPYNRSLPFRKRVDMVLAWLRLPQERRPGLITAYIEQPDSAGHFQRNNEDIKSALSEVNDLLWYLINQLRKAELLPCVNLAIVSDHGMHKINFTPYFSDMITDKNVLIADGAVSRLHKYKSALTVEELTSPFECKHGDKWKVYNRRNMATRKHYQKTPRVGDVIVQGKPGTRFYKNASTNHNLTGDHGYDYINPTMHTIFYAMGPSIKQGILLPAFQNIEYMNLWLSLLGLPEKVPNNGTPGVMDEILIKPPFRPTPFYTTLQECPAKNLHGVNGCQSCSSEDLDHIEWRLSCEKPPQFPFKISSITRRCFQNYCEKLVISGTRTANPVTVVERLIRGQTDLESSCIFANQKYGPCTNRGNSSNFVSKTISAGRSDFANISPIIISWKSGFVHDVLDPLNEYTQKLLDRFGQVYAITGTAYDYDYDGIADKKTRPQPSHLYRVLISCLNGWSLDGISCLEPSNTIALSFIFPHIEKDINCLASEDLLLDYTARLLDVELISGIRLQFPTLSNSQLLQLKTHINLQLW